MYSVSDHTTQINGWIALTKSREEFSHTLNEIGYRCDFIEKGVQVGSEVAKPDVVLTSPIHDHSIIVECKTDGVDSDQYSRYQSLADSPEEFLPYSRYEGEIDPGLYQCEISYSSFSDLSVLPLLLSGSAAFVHFQKTTSGILLSDLNEFDSSELRETFPINMDPDEDIPIEYHPFDIEKPDDYSEFVSAIIQGVIRTAMRDGVLDTEEVLEEAHPYWSHIGDDKKDRYREEANKILMKLEREDVLGFVENIAESDSEWRIHYRTADAIQERLSDVDFVDDVAEVMDQSTID